MTSSRVCTPSVSPITGAVHCAPHACFPTRTTMKTPRSHFPLVSCLHSATSRKATTRVIKFNQRRCYAQVGSTTYLGEPPSSPAGPAPVPPQSTTSTVSETTPQPTASVKPFDAYVLSELQKTAAAQRPATTSTSSRTTAHAPVTLPELVEEYMQHAGRVLDVSLPYESRPGASRRATFAENGSSSNADSALAVVAHAVHDRTGKHHITYSSGFSVQIPGTPEGRSVFVSCAHTLEEVSDRLALGRGHTHANTVVRRISPTP